MEDVLAAQRRYFDSGATRPLRFRREMLTRLELALTRWEGELLEDDPAVKQLTLQA